MNKSVKDILLITLITIAASILLVFSSIGCSKTKITVDSAENIDVETVASTSLEIQDIQTQDTEDTDEIKETGITESIEEDYNLQNEKVLTFKGNKINDNTAIIIIEINTETGEVEGVMQMGFKSFDMDLNSTKVCDFVLTGNITGNLDLNTSKITGMLNGEAITSTDIEGCEDYNVNYEMTADIYDDYSRLKGYFETKTMDDYEFFLKVVSE